MQAAPKRQRHANVDVHDTMKPILPRRVFAPWPALQHRRAMRRGVQPRTGKQAAEEAVVRQVALGRFAWHLESFDLGSCRGQWRAIRQQQRGTKLRQRDRRRTADAAGSAGHQHAPSAHVQRGRQRESFRSWGFLLAWFRWAEQCQPVFAHAARVAGSHGEADAVEVFQISGSPPCGRCPAGREMLPRSVARTGSFLASAAAMPAISATVSRRKKWSGASSSKEPTRCRRFSVPRMRSPASTMRAPGRAYAADGNARRRARRGCAARCVRRRRTDEFGAC